MKSKLTPGRRRVNMVPVAPGFTPGGIDRDVGQEN